MGRINEGSESYRSARVLLRGSVLGKQQNFSTELLEYGFMWCRHCQQEVPGIASSESNTRIVCARCGRGLSGKRDELTRMDPGHSTKSHLDEHSYEGSIQIDDWKLDEDLEAAEDWVRRGKQVGRTGHRGSKTTTSNQEIQWKSHTSHQPARQPYLNRKKPQHQRPRRSWGAWTALCLGIMTSVCGGVLAGLSFSTGRTELWDVGLPLLLCGQAGLLLGLILQLDGLRQTNRETYQSLEELDQRVAELRQTTALMTTTHSGPAQSFYAHMADGASPHLLLADIKGQIDMLTMKMSNEES